MYFKLSHLWAFAYPGLPPHHVHLLISTFFPDSTHGLHHEQDFPPGLFPLNPNDNLDLFIRNCLTLLLFSAYYVYAS